MMRKPLLRCLVTLIGTAALSGLVRGAETAHEIQVVASKYEFTPSTIQVKAGEHVRLTVRSADTIHGFAIPALKLDAHIPKSGDAVVVEFAAPEPGRYEITCSEFCGRGHGQMKAVLVSSPRRQPATH